MDDLAEKERLSLKARIDLEWGKVLDLLARQAVSVPGARLCRDLRLYHDIDEVSLRLKETTEMADLLVNKGNLSLSPFPDLRPILELSQKGGVLEAKDLRGVSDFLGIASDVKRDICRHKGFPALHGIVSTLEELDTVKRGIDGAVDGDGNIKEDATPRLKSLVGRIHELKMRIRERLKEIIHSPRYGEILQEPFFAQRENRYVIPVKTEFKARVDGIVHDQSLSGATVFIEPKELVDMNNRLKIIELEVEDEIRRILKTLSDMILSYHQMISDNLSTMVMLDCIHARARFSLMIGGRPVRFNNRGIINLKAARHPILSLVKEDVIPNDILIPEDIKTLIISGSNSGGKTVILKMIGLFALMVRGGLHLSCGDDSEMAIFHELYTDIGDDQDIGAGLSSFSAHIKTIASIFRYGGPGSLILLDEIAVSTDPSEGAAFAQAILMEMKRRGFKVAVTTHYNPLKALGQSGHGFCNASVELDLKTLSPTYNLVFGIPGRSFAIDIAGRFGIDREILDVASQNLSKTDLYLDQILADLNEKRRGYEEESKKAMDLRLEAEKLIKEQVEITDRLKEAQREIRKMTRSEFNLEISKARQEIARILDEVKRDRRIEKANEAKGLLSEMEARIRGDPLNKDDYIPLEDLKIGDQVEIAGLDIKGILFEDPSDKKRVRIKVGDSEIKVESTRILGLKHRPREAKKVEAKVKVNNDLKLNLDLNLNLSFPTLDLRGKRGEESLGDISKFFDSALLNGIREVSLIHGHGTGRLKRIIREYLKKSPYVLNYHPGGIHEGGDGVTVVELK